MKQQRIKIESSDDLLCIMEDMFNDFLESIFDDDKFSSPVEDEWSYKEEGVTRIWDNKGINIVERYLRRMRLVFEKHFPNDDFNLNSTYYREI